MNGGIFVETLKNFRKKISQCRKKIERGTVQSRPVLDFTLKKENEREPFAPI